jgi:aubergine-like protein
MTVDPKLMMKLVCFSLQEEEQMVCLVPELCYLTGLTDEMRSDFHVMKDISMYTRITPNQRQAAVKKFVRNIQGKKKGMSSIHTLSSLLFVVKFIMLLRDSHCQCYM